MSESFELDAPDHFTAGAIGPPGERVFYLQARQAGALVTLKCEKEHVRALGRYFGSTLSKLGGDKPLTLPSPQRGEGEREPTPQRGEGEKEGELIDFAEPAWIVTAIGAGWDEERNRFVVEIKELLEEEEEAEEEQQTPELEPEPATARVWITRPQAAAFVERAEALMKAGRPICSMCSQPKDPAGHICPRSNGHHPVRHVAT
jgi:uncharacterized repeat protein (TIGR03847 family)